ncbi:hypothetical protein MPSI1_002350 [Malassezia psittaci]|uniref:WD40 repeat-like protein n=1 Tax=Malassezia psittaci TaxID=1821823 RepID=A0AAF0F5X6_9BASI|nr:hypothetical protein MPSI1_002350 [Malassezia psittaci]
MASRLGSEPQLSTSEVNLLIYHYLKESGLRHTCFALRYEARLDDFPAASQTLVQPGQLLAYLQRGLLYTAAERHIQERADPSRSFNVVSSLLSMPDPTIPGKPRTLTPPPTTTPHPTRRRDALPSSFHPRHHQPRTSPEAGRQSTSLAMTPLKNEASEATHMHLHTNTGPSSVPPPKKNKKGTASGSASPMAIDKTDQQTSKLKLRPEHITQLPGHAAEVFGAAWNPTVPKLLASGAGDATVRIWDLSNANEAPTICKHLPSTQAKNISSVAWNLDGTLLASSSYDGILRLWTPQGDLHLVMSMHQGAIFAVRWNVQGNYLLTGSADGTAIVWDVGSGRTRQQIRLHSENVLDVQWLTGTMGQPPGAQRVPHTDAALADNLFATCGADNRVLLCKLGEPKPIRTLLGHTDEVNTIRFDASQTLLASASDDMTVRVWPIDVRGIGVSYTNLHRREAMVLSGHRKEVYTLAWSPTGPGSSHPTQPRILASGSFDHTARLWNVDTGECVHVVEAHSQSVYALCFSPCGQYLATGGIDAKVVLTRLSDKRVIYEYQATGSVLDLSWTSNWPSPSNTTPHDQRLAIAQADKSLTVLNLTPILT